MRSLKILLLTITAAITFSATTYAQTTQSPSAKAGMKLNSESATAANKGNATAVKQTTTTPRDPRLIAGSEAQTASAPQTHTNTNTNSKAAKTSPTPTTNSEGTPRSTLRRLNKICTSKSWP